MPAHQTSPDRLPGGRRPDRPGLLPSTGGSHRPPRRKHRISTPPSRARSNAGNQPVERRSRKSWCATTSTWTRGSYWYAWKTPTSSSPSRRAQIALATREDGTGPGAQQAGAAGQPDRRQRRRQLQPGNPRPRHRSTLNRAEAPTQAGYSEERVTTLTADNHVALATGQPRRPRGTTLQRDTLGAEIKRLEAQIASARTNWRKPKSTCHAP